MVSPDDFAFNAETAASNVFQHLPEQANIQNKALTEFQTMRAWLHANGIKVITLSSRIGQVTPDAVFPNNWFSTFVQPDGRTAIFIYPMLTPNRQAEVQIEELTQALQEHGIRVGDVIDLRTHAKSDEALEGTGSLVLDHQHKIAFASLSPRTSPSLLKIFAELSGYEVVTFSSEDMNHQRIYHTNVMMSIGNQFIVICLESIRDKQERWLVENKLQQTAKEIIPISLEQMHAMAGNILELKTEGAASCLVMSQTAHQHFTAQQIEQLSSFAQPCIVQIDTIEQVGGGSARCMLAEIFTSAFA